MTIYRKQEEVPIYTKEMTDKKMSEYEYKRNRNANAIAVMIISIVPSILIMMIGFFWSMMTFELRICSGSAVFIISIGVFIAIYNKMGWK